MKLAESFAMVALNAQRSLELTMAKKVALRCMAAAVILELHLEGGLQNQVAQMRLKQDTTGGSPEGTYRRTVLVPLAGGKRDLNQELPWWLHKVSRLSAGKLVRFERSMAASLEKRGLLEEIPHLLGCDLYFHSAGVSINEYRSHVEEYARITEFLRADVLEDGTMTDQSVCMLWLLRESGCMHDLFSRNELDQVTRKMVSLMQSRPLAKTLYPLRIRRGFEIAVKQLLQFKKRAVSTQAGSGVNFLFPILERSQAIFIDTEAMLPGPEARLRDVLTRLESKGHRVKVLSRGQVPNLKIDNLVYEAIPHAVYGRVPIHGVRLLPKHLA
ncbi:hypothetical protein [Paenibacillus vini]|uniref:Nucleotidyltransferase n=2 Tax=Paenibacillus TaxID=44249 RepID=A0ABQ4MHA7_9BACL|nr:hypothetical protein [Paenibacillus vini]GIP55361.1 hypothetical protein J42TS3_43960 [Paenibacillus vini]